MSATLTTTYTCDTCGAVAPGYGFTDLLPGMVLPWDTMPRGWLFLRGKHYCDKHEVVVLTPEMLAELRGEVQR